MKKIILLVLTLFLGVLLISCSKNGNYETFDKSVPIIQLNNYYQGTTEVIKYNTYNKDDNKIELKFIKGEEYIPYIDLTSYTAFLGESILNATSLLDKEDVIALEYNISNKKVRFTFDTKKGLIEVDGKMENLIDDDDDSSDGLELLYKSELVKGRDLAYIDYSSYNFKTFRIKDKTYFPLAVLDYIIQPNNNSALFYNYNAIFTFSNSAALSKQKFEDASGNETTAIEQMKTLASETMPKYLIEYNKNVFYFVFDNFYGLKEEKGINSKMSEFFETLSYGKMLSSNVALERANGLNNIFNYLEDSHTVLTVESKAWGESYSTSLPQSMPDDRDLLNTSFSAERNAVYKSAGKKVRDILYSTDGKMAMFALDSFDSLNSYKNEDGTKKSKEELIAEDTYFYIKDCLEQIVKKGGVTDVIIDMSVNAGGDSTIMGKLIALLSKNNEGIVYFSEYNAGNAIRKNIYQVDSNNDGKYDDKDCYGKASSTDTSPNKFNFYLLTSPVAFSCGTAFPFYCNDQKVATIIGAKCGGGECAVANGVLPNGQCFTRSSNTHIVKPTEKGYVGDEGAFEVDIDINYFDYYRLDKLQIIINKEKEKDDE